MNIKHYLEFVEIKTKLASIFPFFIGTTFAYFRYGAFELANFIIMFVSMICFDMATTAINNYIDYKKAENSEYRQQVNVIGSCGIKERQAIAVIIVLLLSASFIGMLLVARTNYLVLLIGAFSFFVGIFYTFGPIPISRMPLGEIVSGFFMGFVITFLTVYTEAYEYGIANISLNNYNIILNINMAEILVISLISIPMIATISNVMLANNICDLETDILNKRYTLVYYIGKKNSLVLFSLLYYAIYIAFALTIIFKVLPLIFIVIFFTFYIVNKNIKKFLKKQDKTITFVNSLKNLFIINFTYLLLLLYVSLTR